MTFTGDWDGADRMLARFANGGFAKVVERAEFAVAEEMRGAMVRGIDGQAPGGARYTAHSSATLPLRRSITGHKGNKIMVSSATSRNSIRVVRAPGGGAFVGIHRGAPGGRVRIMNIQEEGKKIKMTPKMRRFLMLHLRRSIGMSRDAGGGGAQRGYAKERGYIVIPPRPTITPVVAAYRDRIGTLLLQNILKQIGWR